MYENKHSLQNNLLEKNVVCYFDDRLKLCDKVLHKVIVSSSNQFRYIRHVEIPHIYAHDSQIKFIT